jgi:hypothetical protein
LDVETGDHNGSLIPALYDNLNCGLAQVEPASRVQEGKRIIGSTHSVGRRSFVDGAKQCTEFRPTVSNIPDNLRRNIGRLGLRTATLAGY